MVVTYLSSYSGRGVPAAEIKFATVIDLRRWLRLSMLVACVVQSKLAAEGR